MRISMGRTLQTDHLTLQPRIWQGPANVVLDDIVRVDDRLRSQTTSTWKRQWAEAPYDFPNLYIGSDPFPTRLFDPISTYSNDQNSRFNQRQPSVVPYLTLRPTPWVAMSGPGKVKYVG
jgi:hypothetical protein